MSNPKSIPPDALQHADFEFYSRWMGEWRHFSMAITIAYLKKYAASGYLFQVGGKRATLDEAIRHLLSIQNPTT